MYLERLRENLARVEAQIAEALDRAGRKDEVALVAVTKGHPPEAVEAAIAVGLRRCGENRVQELEAKVASVGRERVEWHLIGHLQRNKVRRALPLFDLIHSIDSLRLAEELSKEAGRQGREVHGLVQVNASGEATKGGFSPEETVEAVARIVELPGVRIHGLMTMAPFTDDERILRRTFAETRRLFEQCAREVAGFDARHLSMGMSNDFQIAVEEGSTMVRLGTILFGERKP
ncbi:MAG TPA: YggS family pyridoxal phosphate-dependent enzyme [Longimicrobiales bacterium]